MTSTVSMCSKFINNTEEEKEEEKEEKRKIRN
jgi:hypothetical protein